MGNNEEAISLVQYCAEAVGNTHTFGRITSSIYDTAWVAVLRKPGVPGMCLLPAFAFPHGGISHFQCLKALDIQLRIGHSNYPTLL